MGSGYKAFTAGEVLTASDVNNYLMEQSVMTFGGSAARSSAIGTANFEEGMTSYLTDTDKLEVYNGTNWVSVTPTSNQGLTLINTTSFSGVSSVSLPAGTFTNTYTNYLLTFPGIVPSGTNVDLTMRVRASGTDLSGSVYNSTTLGGPTTSFTNSLSQTSWTVGGSNASDTRKLFSINLFEPTKAVYTTGYSVGTSDSGGYGIFRWYGVANTNAYDSVTLFVSSGTFAGKILVYGFNE